MTRTDHDSWDLRSGVGTTATMVAAARAVATRQPQAIINDPWAAPLVEAVGIESLSRLVELGTPPADTGLGSDLRLQPMIDSFAVRTRFFDEFFTAATNSDIRQVVILAAGLDSRPIDCRGRTVRSSMKWIYRAFSRSKRAFSTGWV
jgi:methyltransferase (TIGR00027 family)